MREFIKTRQCATLTWLIIFFLYRVSNEEIERQTYVGQVSVADQRHELQLDREREREWQKDVCRFGVANQTHEILFFAGEQKFM